jgi:hypothetical protein
MTHFTESTIEEALLARQQDRLSLPRVMRGEVRYFRRLKNEN